MSAVMGLLPRTGTVQYRGNTAGTTEALVAAGAVLVPERRALFTDMTVEDNLQLGFYVRRRAGERDSQPSMRELRHRVLVLARYSTRRQATCHWVSSVSSKSPAPSVSARACCCWMNQPRACALRKSNVSRRYCVSYVPRAWAYC
jgi:hypothetical protein